MFIISMFHINIKNFHNNGRPNKTTLTILSQLKITKVNIIEKFGRGNIVTVDKRKDTKLIFGLNIILEILILSTKQ